MNRYTYQAPAVLGMLSLAGFGVLAFAVHTGIAQPHDEAFLVALRQNGGSESASLFRWFLAMVNDFTRLGSVTVLSLITLLMCGALLVARKIRAALYFFLYAVGGFGLNGALKQVFSRTRPDVIEPLSAVYTSSFPSSHAMLSAVIFLGGAVVVNRFICARGLRLYSIAIGVLLVFLTGWSRLYLGVHYPSDVLAGWCGGLAWFCLWWMVLSVLVYRKQNPSIL